jgi:hypothetical protein
MDFKIFIGKYDINEKKVKSVKIPGIHKSTKVNDRQCDTARGYWCRAIDYRLKEYYLCKTEEHHYYISYI